ncbi:MAG: hypothetical protein HY053_00255 [Proteobacteria bacterium]|nr:hypothetical protein [Pseudomonadota bacterium]
MISVILYGRNDSHGYNLHKRAAISLNCIAEMLDAPNDEILFVDYNTPDDFISFPEAIADTLTERCKKMLRIFRVRPSHHARFRAETDLVALEPVSRNVAIRRSNPANRWLLCTNTDMIFAPKPPFKSLSGLVANLEDGFYELPRFDLPDLLWEGLNRMTPLENIATVEKWGLGYHINEIICRPKEILFDAPGDFQLFPRAAGFELQGFDERYNLGWHMDSNLGKRFYIHYGIVRSLDERVSGWHCNHTRTQSIAHRSGRRTNDMDEVFTQVVRADLPHQKDSWGLVNEEIEEIRLDIDRGQSLLRALDKVSGAPAKEPYLAPEKSSELLACPPAHLKPYIADILYSFHRKTVVGYCGYDPEMFAAFHEVWQALGFTGPIHLIGRKEDREFSTGQPCLSVEEADRRCEMFIGDYGVLKLEMDEKRVECLHNNRCMLAVLEQLMILERAQLKDPSHTPRKFMVLNGAQPFVCAVMQHYTNMQENPFGTRIRHGYVVPPKKMETRPQAPEKKTGT